MYTHSSNLQPIGLHDDELFAHSSQLQLAILAMLEEVPQLGTRQQLVVE
ncbi:hypothetical protein [Alicyclobacillus sp. SO9]|nr:hypothetical protein [Alicyclobacillus sp. SO9]QQE80983.1 hypothetical protein GI364_11735 [Alicyclobacillus sp. SO9]